MKSLFIHTIVAVGVAGGLTLGMAQAVQAKGKAPKEHSVTGCLQKDANAYVVTGVGKKGKKKVEITETAPNVNLASQVGHKVTIRGTRAGASAKGDEHLRADQVKMVSASCS